MDTPQSDAPAGSGTAPPATNVKYLLLRTLREVLGSGYAEKVQKKLDDAPNTRSGLEAAIESCCKLIRLTIDEQKAKEVERRCRGILDKM